MRFLRERFPEVSRPPQVSFLFVPVLFLKLLGKPHTLEKFNGRMNRETSLSVGAGIYSPRILVYVAFTRSVPTVRHIYACVWYICIQLPEEETGKKNRQTRVEFLAAPSLPTYPVVLNR